MRRARPPGTARRRQWLVVGGAVLFVVAFAGSVVRFYTDLLWFRELRLTPVFWRTYEARLLLGLAGGVGAALIVAVNLEVARRAAPRYRFLGPLGDPAERYRSLFRPYAGWVNAGVAALVGLLAGLSTSAAWDRYLLWRRAQPFGVRDPLFGRDISFYVFSVPFQRIIVGWLFGILFASLFLSVVAHLLAGSISPEPARIDVRPAVKVHLSVVLGLIAALKAWSYRLDAFDLLLSPRGTVTGASYTDVHAQLPALRLLGVIALVAAAIFLANIRFRGWLLPGAAIGLWALSSLLVGGLIPWVVQRFTVEPNESVRERPYIQRNIEATRRAFGLDRIRLQEFPADATLSEAVVAENRDTIDNVRLWNPAVLAESFQRLQAIRTYYDFKDIDIDRYVVDGKLRQVMLAPREVVPDRIEARARNWINMRLTYTHGYGIVAIPANSANPEGQPEFIVRDLPPQGPPELVPRRPGVYFGEQMGGYAIVRTRRRELDYPVGERNEFTTYTGSGGIPLSNLARRLAFAWRFGDANLLISNFITPQSRVLMRRDIVERARTVAPFLRFDRDPYIVSVDGRLLWVIDAYTTTDRYPYSQELSLSELFAGQHSGTINYIRNSVKVVVDAYDGTIRFYVVDSGDPLIATYQTIFPEMFAPADQMPPGLRAHLRYPEDLFIVQAARYRLYHMTDADRLYSREDVWDFPLVPVGEATEVMRPYYVLMKLPGETKAELVLMLPFTPVDKPVLNGWIAARMDPEHYGQIMGFTFPRGRPIEGPQNIGPRIEQQPQISAQFSLWERAGSAVVRGDLLVIPIGQTVMYVRPIYLRAAQAAMPELKMVVVVHGDRIGFEPTLKASLAKVLTGQERLVGPPAVPGGAPAASPPPAGDVGSLLDQAAQHFAAADAALRQGDLAAYQREVRAAQQAVEEARRRMRP